MAKNNEDFLNAAKPLIKWLNKHHQPMAKILVTVDSAKVVIGDRIVHTEEFVPD